MRWLLESRDLLEGENYVAVGEVGIGRSRLLRWLKYGHRSVARAVSEVTVFNAERKKCNLRVRYVCHLICRVAHRCITFGCDSLTVFT